eukprot:Sspe_Gene.27837::Locus_12233_Transcript_1_3_Confidence_0.600_Length_688::g.27837::m.27837
MFRTLPRLCAAEAAHLELQHEKMKNLLKIVTGDVQLKNRAPVKECTIEQVFGSQWKSELQQWFDKTYSAGMDKADKAAAQARLNKYLQRLSLTRYTSRELASFMLSGAHKVDELAKAQQVADAKEFIAANGDAKFVEHVKAEGKNANWTQEECDAFVKMVKSA